MLLKHTIVTGFGYCLTIIRQYNFLVTRKMTSGDGEQILDRQLILADDGYTINETGHNVLIVLITMFWFLIYGIETVLF